MAAVAGVAVAAVVLAACSSSSSSSRAAASAKSSTGAKGAPSGSPVVFHAVVSETGGASFLGSREAKALQILAKQVNASGGIDGHPMSVDIKDNETNPSTAVQIASAWVGKGVPFILDGSIVATDKAVDALATSKGPFMYDLSPGTHPAPGSMVFSAGLSTTADAQAYLTFLKSKGLTKIAFMNSTDASGTDGYTQFTKQLATSTFSSTFTVVDHETFSPSAVSVTTQMAKIKAANPQALVVWTTGTPLGTVLKAMSSLGMSNLPMVTTTGNASVSELNSFAGIVPKHIYFPTGPLYVNPSQLTGGVASAVKAFDAAVTADGGHPGDGWGLAYDPALLLVGALKHLGVNATATQILHYMENLHNVPGVYGDYNTSTSDHRGVHAANITMTTWNGKSFVPVSAPGGGPIGG